MFFNFVFISSFGCFDGSPEIVTGLFPIVSVSGFKGRCPRWQGWSNIAVNPWFLVGVDADCFGRNYIVYTLPDETRLYTSWWNTSYIWSYVIKHIWSVCFISSRVVVVCEQQIDILVIIHWKSLWSTGWVLFNWLVKMVHKSVINNCFVSMNQNDFIQYNSNWKVMKMYWSKSVGTLCDTYTVLHKSYGPRFVCLYFGAWIATVLIHFCIERPGYSSKISFCVLQ